MPGLHLLGLNAPEIARRVQPGQYCYLIEPAPRGLLLPVLPVGGFDRVSGRVDLYVDERSDRWTAALLGLREGDSATLDGPLGRGFEIDTRSRHVLMVADEAGLPRVRAVVDEAVATGRRVTVLLGAPTASAVFPSTLLPDEAEYVVATDDGTLGHHGPVTDLLTTYEAWADQCFAAGSPPMLTRMTTLARGRDERMGVARLGRRRVRRASASAVGARRRAWLQVALPHDIGCALGVCLGCVVGGERGPLRACREGPAFAADELRWERAT